MYPILTIFGREIGTYAICSFLGLFASIIVIAKLSKSNKMAFEDIILMVITIAAGILIGGHLLYAITNFGKIIKYTVIIFEKIKTNELKLSQLVYVITQSFGGMVFYGGFIGASIALAIYLKSAKIANKNELIDSFAVCVPLFHTFGRIGCFLGGCCYGIESKFGFVADNHLLPEMSGVRRFPVSLLESVFNLLLFLFLLYLFNTGKTPGKLIFVYMIIYPMGRFVFEFFRGDEIRGIFLTLSTSQWISIILFAIGIVFIKKTKKTKEDILKSTS